MASMPAVLERALSEVGFDPDPRTRELPPDSLIHKSIVCAGRTSFRHFKTACRTQRGISLCNFVNLPPGLR